MGLWDDKCKKCMKNTWECKCENQEKIKDEPKTMEELKENMNDTITSKKKK